MLTHKINMPAKYFFYWWAALLILAAPARVTSLLERGANTLGLIFWLVGITAVAYGLARLGWAQGWFRKNTR